MFPRTFPFSLPVLVSFSGELNAFLNILDGVETLNPRVALNI